MYFELPQCSSSVRVWVGGLQPGAALVVVCLAVVTLPPRSTSLAVAGFRLVGCSVCRQLNDSTQSRCGGVAQRGVPVCPRRPGTRARDEENVGSCSTPHRNSSPMSFSSSNCAFVCFRSSDSCCRNSSDSPRSFGLPLNCLLTIR